MHWQNIIPSKFEICGVQLPGRGARYTEPQFKSFPSLIKTLADVIHTQDTLPFSFFGHSFGGLIAFEVARHLQKMGRRIPVHIFASGCGAPRYREISRNLHRLADDELVDTLRHYDGTPPDLLNNQELMELALPTIRADFLLASDYRYASAPPLELSLTALAGRTDELSNMKIIGGWAEEVTGEFDIQWFDGGHFFIESQREALLSFLISKLNDLTSTLPELHACRPDQPHLDASINNANVSFTRGG
ncbi:thioesterase II family protein [Burkholderia metallica]